MLLTFLCLSFSLQSFTQTGAGDFSLTPISTIDKKMVNFNDEMSVFVGSDNVNHYFMVNMSLFPNLFEKSYFLNAVYGDPILICNQSDLNSTILGFSANKSYSIGFLKSRLQSLKDKAQKSGNEMNTEEKTAYVKKSEKLFQLSNAILFPENVTQNLLCDSALPFCTGTNYQFPAGVGAGSAQSGPCYNCLSTTPNPAWYYMKIANPGDLHIYMYSTPSKDIDFCCWGPFLNQQSCTQLTCNKVIDCSYSPNPTETCDIYSASTGQYYILLITNYSQQPCNINFSQTSGSGSTDCTILPPPAGNNGPLCVGETLILNANPVVGATYHWTGPAGFISNLQNPVLFNVSLANAGVYSLTITVNGQTSQPTTTNVIVYPRPTGGLMGGDTICEGNSTNLTVVLTGSPPWTIKISNGLNVQTYSLIGTSTYIVPVTPLVNTTYTLTYVEDNHCTATQFGGTANVAIDPPLTVSNVVADCQPDNLHYIVSFEIAGGMPSTYTITPNNGSISAGPPYIFTSNLIPESTPYAFTVTDEVDCTPQVISGSQSCICPVQAQVSGTTSLCLGESTDITITLTGESPWDVTYTTNGGNPQNLVINSSPYTFSVTPTISSAYALTHVQDANCIGTVSGNATVTVNPIPVAYFNATTECNGIQTEFTDASTVSSGIVSSWEWDFDDGNTSNAQNPDHLYTNFGTYDVTLLVTTNNGCTHSITKPVIVNPYPIVDAGEEQTISYGASTTLTGTVTGGSGDYQYQWEPADSLLDATVANPQTKNLRGTTFFTLTVTDQDGGCVNSDATAVNITGYPINGSIFANPPKICYGEQKYIDAMISGGAGNLTFSWTSTPPGFTSNLEDITVQPEVTTTYKLRVTDDFGNFKDFNITITVNPLPVADAGDDVSIPNGTFTIIHGSATSGTTPYNYSWSPADSLSDPTIANPRTKQLTVSTYFQLTIWDNEGCSDVDSVLVEVTGGPLSIAPFAQSPAICIGESTQLHANPSGGAGSINYSYTWESNPTDPSLASQLNIAEPIVTPPLGNTRYTYTVTVNDGFNNKTGNVNVDVNPLPEINLTQGFIHVSNNGDTIFTCIYDTITLDAGSGNKRYLWSNGAATQTITTKTTGIAYDNQDFSVEVTDFSQPTNCTNTDKVVVIFAFNECGYGIGENDNISLNLYPNPSEDITTLTMKGVKKEISLQLLNSSGQVVYSKQFSGLNGGTFITPLNVRSLPLGVYFLKLTNTDINRLIKLIKK
ncbi:MAG: PKD domain-containing protein [Lentimicrobiaceae bacterium]|nr:PKD domain-containing protein [Lentimicrobiaceae bacterium]